MYQGNITHLFVAIQDSLDVINATTANTKVLQHKNNIKSGLEILYLSRNLNNTQYVAIKNKLVNSLNQMTIQYTCFNNDYVLTDMMKENMKNIENYLNEILDYYDNEYAEIKGENNESNIT